jgi:bifunctional DNA-binding transcriptional regulator/antitoxin component of YhaV-PrlF toxin-antitoxin module
MQHCRMTTLTLSKRGSLTLPPEIRRKMGLDKVRNPMLLVEERDGGLFLHPAATVPVRDLPKAQIKAWIARDEADMKAFQAAGKPRKK